jgi:hypothetical protein
MLVSRNSTEMKAGAIQGTHAAGLAGAGVGLAVEFGQIGFRGDRAGCGQLMAESLEEQFVHA